MSTQGSLPGFAPNQPTDRFFLAIFPDASEAGRLAALAHGLLGRHGLGAAAVAAPRLHVTLFHLGDYAGQPPGLAEGASDALAQVVAAPFTVRFDRFGSFGNRRAKSPLVLAAGDGNQALHELHGQLAAYLRANGQGLATQGSFVPHMTVAYGRTVLSVEAIEPVLWRAGEVRLVHSLLGRTRHVPLASRVLAGG